MTNLSAGRNYEEKDPNHYPEFRKIRGKKITITPVITNISLTTRSHLSSPGGVDSITKPRCDGLASLRSARRTHQVVGTRVVQTDKGIRAITRFTSEIQSASDACDAIASWQDG